MVSSIDMKMAQAAMLFSVLMTGCAVGAGTPEEADLEQADVDVASSEQALEGEQDETRGGVIPGKTDIGAPIGKGGPIQGPIGKGAPLVPGVGGPIQGPVDKGAPLIPGPGAQVGQQPFPVGQAGGFPGGPFGGSPFGGSPFGGFPGATPGGFGWSPYGGLGGLGGLGGYPGGLGGLGGLGGYPGGLGGLGGLGGGLGGLGGGLGGLGGAPYGAFAPGTPFP